MSKWGMIETMRDYGFSDTDILEMFVYWMSGNEIEQCVEDYLNDRDLKINDNNEIVEKD